MPGPGTAARIHTTDCDRRMLRSLPRGEWVGPSKWGRRRCRGGVGGAVQVWCCSSGRSSGGCGSVAEAPVDIAGSKAGAGDALRTRRSEALGFTNVLGGISVGPAAGASCLVSH